MAYLKPGPFKGMRVILMALNGLTIKNFNLKWLIYEFVTFATAINLWSGIVGEISSSIFYFSL